MRLPLLFTWLLLSALTNAHSRQDGQIVSCEPKHYCFLNLCIPLQNGASCCTQPNSPHSHHICPPGKECCGKGCCKEGWKCHSDGFCRPSRTTQCSTFVTTIVKPVTTFTEKVTKTITPEPVTPSDAPTSYPVPTSGGSSARSSTTPASEHPEDPVSSTFTDYLPSSLSSAHSQTASTDSDVQASTNISSVKQSTRTNEETLTTHSNESKITATHDGTEPVTATIRTSSKPSDTGVPDLSFGETTTNGVDGSSTSAISSRSSAQETTSGSNDKGTNINATGPSESVNKSQSSPTDTLATSDPAPIVTTNSNGQAVTQTLEPSSTQPTGGALSDQTSAQSGTFGTQSGGVVLSTGQSNTAGVEQPTDVAPGTATTNSDGPTLTILPSGLPGSGGSSHPTGSNTVITLPGGVLSTVTSEGGPDATDVTRQTPSDSSSAVPTISDTVVTNTNGQITTLTGSQVTTFPGEQVTTLSDGKITTLTGGEGTTISGGQVTTLSDGQVSTRPCIEISTLIGGRVTSFPCAKITTSPSGPTPTLPANSITTTLPPDAAVTLPCIPISTSINGIITTITDVRFSTRPDGGITTLPCILEGTTTTIPTRTTTGDTDFIIPVTTSVNGPKPTDSGSVIPCNLWFFNFCLHWKDFDILGWIIVNPPGKYSIGPPPSISIPPVAGITININGPLPSWPSYTIGPDRMPTFPPEPTGPDEECETETAEICLTRTSFAVSVSQTTAVTTGSQVLTTCGTVYGCKVQDVSSTQTTTSTETATGTPIPHVVYPREGRNATLVAEVQTLLTEFVKYSADIYASNTKYLGMNFWRLNLTVDQADEIRKYETVASVLVECDNDIFECYDPTISLAWQEDAPEQLSYISWPNTDPRTPFSEVRDRYYFDDSDGKDIDVWVMDSGLTIENIEFDHWSRDGIDWLIKIPDYDGVAREDDCQTDVNLVLSGKAHGTSMFSVIAGKTLGVAKSVKPHIARLPRQISSGGLWTTEDYIETMAALDEKLADEGGANGVLLLAQYYPRTPFYRKDEKGKVIELSGEKFDDSFGFELRLYAILRSIIDKGMLVITGSGNERKATIDGWPQNFGKKDDTLRIPELLVVGAVQPEEPGDGVLGYGTTDLAQGLPHVYAPGYRVRAADGNSVNWGAGYYKNTQGTSIASAITVGLAASLLKMAQLEALLDDNGALVPATAAGIRQYIVDKSWSRGKLGFNDVDGLLERNGIWNGLDLNQRACPWNPNNPLKQRRQDEGPACEIPLPSSTTTTTTSKSSTTSRTPIPTLTTTFVGTITTPAGSSCAATSTTTQCVEFIGDTGPCIKSATCVSWVNTETTSKPASTTTEDPVTPLATKAVKCENEADFPGHGDVDPNSQSSYTSSVCGEANLAQDRAKTIGPGDDAVEATKRDGGGISYFYSISWIDGCKTETDSQYIQTPIGENGPTCQQILEGAYSKCINGGVGGYIDAGCLRYQFIGAK